MMHRNYADFRSKFRYREREKNLDSRWLCLNYGTISGKLMDCVLAGGAAQSHTTISYPTTSTLRYFYSRALPEAS